MCEIARVMGDEKSRDSVGRSNCRRRDVTRASGIAIILRDGGSAAVLMPGGGGKSIRRHRTDVRPGEGVFISGLPPGSHRRRDIDLNICRHATTRGEPGALQRPRGSDERDGTSFLVVKLVRAFGGCLGTKRR